MWVPGSVFFLIPVVMLSIRLLDSSRMMASKKMNYKTVKAKLSAH